MSKFLNYNIYLQTIQHPNTYSYSDTIGSILYMLCYLENTNLFYVYEEIYKLFDTNQYCIFHNIQEKIRFKTYSLLHKHESYPYKRSMVQYNGFVKDILGITNYNDLAYNNYNPKLNNVLFDSTVKNIFKARHYQSHKIEYNNLKNIESDKKISIFKPITLDHNKITSFSNNHYFICLPTYRLENNLDIKIYDIIIQCIIKNTKYQNLILISGDNEYKQYFYDKYGIITTEQYPQINYGIKSTTKRKGNDVLFNSKSKSNLISQMTDYLYIQESNASYIDFFGLVRSLRSELSKTLPQNSFTDFLLKDQIQCIDMIGILLKTKKFIQNGKD